MDRTFAALSDSTRRAILARLAQGETTVTELAEPFSLSQPAISKHLRVLEHAGLITRVRRGRRVLCFIEGEAFAEVTDWLERYRRLWDESFQRLDGVLRDLKKKEPRHGRND